MKPKPKKIRVDLLPEDFENVNYTNPWACPLCKAMNRNFPEHKWRVAPTYVRHDFDDAKPIYIINLRNWNPTICRNVTECYLKGDKTIYYVELERV